MNRYYAYIRVSTVKQGERSSSLREQRAAIESYAKRNSLEIVEWFEEMETAAKRGRQLFTHMMRRLKRHEARGVIIHKIDRSARNLRDWADLGALIDSGVEVHFAHESLDLHSRGGRLSADIQAVVAADYIRNLRDEVVKGFVGRLKQGLFPLPAPVGYQNQGGGLPKIPDPATAPLVRQAFELYATGGYNLKTLRMELHARGLRNKGGGPLSVSGLSDLLNNPFYMGLIHIRTTGETYQGVHEPLISKRLFDQVQAVLHGRAKNKGLKHDFLYRRTLRCVHCGYRLIGELQKGRVYYRCQTPGCPTRCLREDAIISQIKDALAQLKLEPLELEALREECLLVLHTTVSSKQETAEALRLNISQADERLRRLTDAYIDRLIDKELFAERKASLLEERLNLRQKLDDVLAGRTSVQADVTEFLELLNTLSSNDNSANPRENWELLEKVTSNRGVDRKYVVYEWKSAYQVLATRQEFAYGGPSRCTPRTFRAQGSHGKQKRSKSDSSSPRPFHRLAKQIVSHLRAQFADGSDSTDKAA